MFKEAVLICSCFYPYPFILLRSPDQTLSAALVSLVFFPSTPFSKRYKTRYHGHNPPFSSICYMPCHLVVCLKVNMFLLWCCFIIISVHFHLEYFFIALALNHPVQKYTTSYGYVDYSAGQYWSLCFHLYIESLFGEDEKTR